jgi:hypothetical protein
MMVVIQSVSEVNTPLVPSMVECYNDDDWQMGPDLQLNFGSNCIRLDVKAFTLLILL